jgi:hypothetical protein
MSFWENNNKILIKQYHGLIEELTRDDAGQKSDDILDPEDIKIETSPEGTPSLRVKGLYVHSPRDPVREAGRLAETASKEIGPVIILGFGLGYAAQAAAELGRPVIIVEKYRNLLVKAFEQRDLGNLLSRHKLIFVPGGTGEGITSALDAADKLVSADETAGRKTKPSIIRNRTLTNLDEQWYGAVEERVRTWTMKDDVNEATLKRFGKRWVSNLSHNMSAIRDYPGISRLAGLAAQTENSAALPVFLAAAGPSLDKCASLLHDIRQRCVVVAVDTNLRFFTNRGVYPDFVLVVDPQFWNNRHLDRCTSRCVMLVAESGVYPPVLRLPYKSICLCGSLFPLGSFIEKRVDSKGQLGTGGSVATTAWDFARSLGGNEIWIAGLDLAFPGLKTHFHGALFEDRSHAGSNRFNPAEKWIIRTLRDGLPFKAPSSAGGQVLTDRRLSLYAAWFENRFQQNKKLHNYGLFQNGLAISGLETADVERLLALPERRDEIDQRLTTAFSQIEEDFNQPEEARKRGERYENAVSILTQGLENVRRASLQGAALAEQAMRRGTDSSQQNKTLKELDKITRLINESEVKEIAGFLFPPVENGKDEGDPFRAYMASSFKLFSFLAEAAEFNLKKITANKRG